MRNIGHRSLAVMMIWIRRSLSFLIFAAVMASCSLCLGQDPNNKTKPVKETGMGTEQPYFNAQAGKSCCPVSWPQTR